MTLLELCAICENGSVHSSRTYSVIPRQLYAQECTTTFRADSLLNLLPTDGQYRARIIDCYINAPTPSTYQSTKKNINAYLRIDDFFSDGWRRTDRSGKLYHSRLTISDLLNCSVTEPLDSFLPINTAFMTDRLSKELVIHIDSIRYTRSRALPKDKVASSDNIFAPFRKPIILFIAVEIIKDDTIQ